VAEMSVVYAGITIVYTEADNLWRFELRGRDRSADSLAKAKEFIDKHPAEKGKPFERVKAYLTSRFDGEYKPCEITSIAESSWGTNCAWISIDGKRKKENVGRLIPATPENDSIIAQIVVMNAERTKLTKQIGTLDSSMKRYKVPSEEGEKEST
jgi:hypothetical protein